MDEQQKELEAATIKADLKVAPIVAKLHQIRKGNHPKAAQLPAKLREFEQSSMPQDDTSPSAVRAKHKSEAKSQKGESLPLAVPFVLGLFLAVILLLGHWEGRFGTAGKLEGPDSYMWLLQTERLHDGAGWYDTSSPRSNAPYGDTLHWGRPFQVVLLLPALTFAWLFGFHQALFLWGIVVGPVLLVPTTVLIVWALRPLLNRFQLLLACSLFLANPAIVTNFFPAQADHRCLNTLLFTAVLGLSIRVLYSRLNEMHLWLLGLLFAIGLWSSMEMLLPICLLQGTFFALWLLREGIWARRACRVSLATFVFTVAALLLHRPPSIWSHDFEDDSLSSLQVILLAFLVIAWGIQWKFIYTWTKIGKFGMAFASGILTLAVIYRLHSTFFHGPFGDVNPEVQRIWREKVEDTTPLAGFSLAAIAVICYFIGMALLAWPTALLLAWRARISARPRWLFLSVSLTAAIVLTLFVADRCSTQASLYAMGPISILLSNLSPMKRWYSPIRLATLLVCGTAGLALSFLLTNLQLLEAAHSVKPAHSPISPSNGGEIRTLDQLPTIALSDFLDRAPLARPLRIMTFLDLSPELMYRTPCETVATPYHRNTDGILDDFHVMEAVDDSAAEAIVRRRRVTYILVCPTLDESRSYYDTSKPGSLYQRLLENHPPAWLTAVELPPELRNDFELWSVVPRNSPSVKYSPSDLRLLRRTLLSSL